MPERFLGLQDDNINVQILRMKSTIKQESIRTLKRTGFTHLYVRTLVPGSATLLSESSAPSFCCATAQHRRLSWIYTLSVHQNEFT